MYTFEDIDLSILFADTVRAIEINQAWKELFRTAGHVSPVVQNAGQIAIVDVNMSTFRM
jgi:hypothetical protein